MCEKFVFFFITLLSIHAGTVNAAIIDLKTVSLMAGSNSLSFDINGISATVTAYHVEYNSADSSTPIYGPFSTGTAENSSNWYIPYFGRSTNKVTNTTFGLGLAESENLGQTDNNIQQGFDNRSVIGALPSFEFALFSFDAPVDVSQVILDSVSNFKNHVWVAGGNTDPDFTLDFTSAFGGYNFINSPHSAGPIHSFSPMEGITYLAIGAPPRADLIGDLGSVTGVTNSAQFYIDGINVSAVPVPAAIWLFASSLICLIGVARRRKA